uniref:Uncharacterized protein n=1 Tax=Physcomitrium patens TaxID=3218 RepID=A0A2K1KH86_PHYPA|nr:hypothetical protein PHYPA_009519 [Physcomitrium patens]
MQLPTKKGARQSLQPLIHRPSSYHVDKLERMKDTSFAAKICRYGSSKKKPRSRYRRLPEDPATSFNTA